MNKSVFIPAPPVDIVGAIVNSIRDSNSPLAPGTNQIYLRNASPEDPVVSLTDYATDMLYVAGSSTSFTYTKRNLPPSGGLSVWTRQSQSPEKDYCLKAIATVCVDETLSGVNDSGYRGCQY